MLCRCRRTAQFGSGFRSVILAAIDIAVFFFFVIFAGGGGSIFLVFFFELFLVVYLFRFGCFGRSGFAPFGGGGSWEASEISVAVIEAGEIYLRAHLSRLRKRLLHRRLRSLRNLHSCRCWVSHQTQPCSDREDRGNQLPRIGEKGCQVRSDHITTRRSERKYHGRRTLPELCR